MGRRPLKVASWRLHPRARGFTKNSLIILLAFPLTCFASFGREDEGQGWPMPLIEAWLGWSAKGYAEVKAAPEASWDGDTSRLQIGSAPK
jgi:hypothetical protein